MHEHAFRALGAEVSNAHGYLIARVGAGRLRGAEIEFRTPSVGATKNAMLAAVVAEGTTTIRNVAMEPEVVDLANFLIAMGARIAGIGSDTLVDRGRGRTARRRLRDHSRSHRRPERCSCAAPPRAATSRVTRCNPQHLEALTKKLAECGASHQRRRLGAGEGRPHQRRHRHDDRAVSRLPDRPAAADADVPMHGARHERGRRDDFQRALLVRQRTRAHGRRRPRRDGEQQRAGQRRHAALGRARRSARHPGRRRPRRRRPRGARERPRSSAWSTSTAATSVSRRCSRRWAARCSAPAASRRSWSPTGTFETSAYPIAQRASG